MKNLTLRVAEDTVDALDDEADERGLSRSEYVRDILASRHDEDAITDEYERKIEDLETTVERLENEKRVIIEQREENAELVEYVEQEKSLSQRKAQAGIGTRTKWWLFGMD